MSKIKLLTFESWVTRVEWYKYAIEHEDDVPLLLLDRSPCQDPFFDPYASTWEERQPLISGLCRALKWFKEGDQFIYITRIDPSVFSREGRFVNGKGPYYAGVAALTVDKVWESHSKAAQNFKPRRYVVNPVITPYPPNLAFVMEPKAAVSHRSSISYDAHRVPHIPTDKDDKFWLEQYMGYFNRQRDKALRAARCKINTAGERKAIQLDFSRAPIFTSADWDNRKLNVQGLLIDEKCAKHLQSQILSSYA